MKTVMITGCNRGIGLMLLKRFAKEGYNVIAHTRNRKDVWEEQCRTIEELYHITIYKVYFDLEKKDEVESGIQDVIDMNIPIDVLINNAGILISKPLMFLTYDDLERIFMVNYFSLTMITKGVASIMIRQPYGNIINISSCMGESHQPGGACYDASKAALNQFTRSIAQELAPFNIRVNAVAGGIINSDMITGLDENGREKMIKATALKRIAETDEIANVVFFLASDQASYLTGAIISVDGGIIV